MIKTRILQGVGGRWILALAAVPIVILGACTVGTPEAPFPAPTPTAIRSSDSAGSPGVYTVGSGRALWVTRDSASIIIDAEQIALLHPFSLRGQGISFDTSTGPVVSVEEDVVAMPFRSADSSAGVALVRSDGYEMAVLMYGGPGSTVGSVTFLPEYGLTALTVREDAGDRLITFNNYGMRQFDVPVASALGSLRYSVDESRYMVLDRRSLLGELELVSLERPENSVVLTSDDVTADGENLFESLAAVVDSWG